MAASAHGHMTPPFDASLLRSSACNNNPSPGDFTPRQKVRRKLMLSAEKALKVLSLVMMILAAAGCFAMWTRTAHAQGFSQQQQQLEQARTNERTSTQVTEMDRRLDKLELKQADQDIRISGEDSRISAIYAFGGGVSTIMIVLQLFSILAPQKSKAV